MATMKGVDISTWNGNVNFDTLKANGIKFVIIRIGYGKKDYQKDDKFEQNVNKAIAAGMPWGVYTYSYARDKSSGVAEANCVIKWLNGRIPTFGIWYDMEDSSTIGGDLAGAATGFLETLKAKGVYPTIGVYSMLSWFNNRLTAPIFDKYEKWVAQWNATDDYKKAHGIWQYSDSVRIGGITFDANLSYKDYTPKPVTPTPAPVEDDTLTIDQFREMYHTMRIKWQDNDAGKWSNEARQWIISNNLISGIGNDKTGKPNYAWEDLITREQFVTLLYRYAKMIGKA